MSGLLQLPVPTMLRATYVVAAGSSGAELHELASSAVGELDLQDGVRSFVLDALAGNNVSITEMEAPAPGASEQRWRHFGASDREVAAFAPPRRVVVIRTAARPPMLPLHEVAGRVVASAVGSRLGADVLDVFAGKILHPGALIEGLGAPTRPLVTSAVLDIWASGPDAGLWQTTKGLGRFGLPELQINGVPRELERRCQPVLFGLAEALTRRWYDAIRAAPSASTIELPDVIDVSTADIAAAHDLEPQMATSCTVRLEIDPGPPGRATMLSVVPVQAQEPVSEFLATITDQLVARVHERAGVRAVPQGWSAAMDRHVEKFFGPVDVALAEKIPAPGVPSIDLCLHDHTAGGRPRLRTRGMSDQAMATPNGAGVPNRAELIMYLPADWTFFTPEGAIDERRWWVGAAFKRIALHPHTHHTWLSDGHTITLSPDGVTPLHPSTLFTDALLAFPLEHPDLLRFEYGGTRAFFLQVIFLTPAEANLFRTGGWDAFAEFGEDFNLFFEPGRPCSVTGARPGDKTPRPRSRRARRRE